MTQKFFKGDFYIAETFKDSDGNAIAVPSHVRILYFTRSQAGIITVERNGNTTTNCYVSEDGNTLVASLPLSRKKVGKGELLKVVEIITEDANFPDGSKISATPGTTDVVLTDSASDDDETVTSEAISVVMMYGYSAYQLAVLYGYEGTEAEWAAELAAAQEAASAANAAAEKANAAAVAAESVAKMNAGLLGLVVEDGEMVLVQNAETGTVVGGEIDDDGMVEIEFEV